MDRSKIYILVVDDEPGLRGGIQEALLREGYRVDAAQDAAQARQKISARLYNLVITDLRMPGMDGLKMMRRVRSQASGTLFILITAYGTVENAVEAMKDGAYDYLTKPIDLRRLRMLVAKALEFQAVVTENNELRLRLRKRCEPSLLLGSTEAIRRIKRLVDEVAQSDVTVLIEGESGTGKEIVARSIHLKSNRAHKPFVTVNCAALPDPLVEAELFGHVKGAFTGAIGDRQGRFQMADQGTLFLDEIADLSAKGQGNLLRVLEGGVFQPVGSPQTHKVNVRVLAATNRALEDAVAEKRFREDLYYRLQVVPISIPPLRDRMEDIPLLVESFLEHFTLRHHRGTKHFSNRAMKQVTGHAWPGNVRQLRNTIERLVITTRRVEIDLDDLPPFLRNQDANASGFIIRAGMSLAEVEKMLIEKTLALVTSHREQAASLLGISRRSLQYKLKEYRLLHEDDDPGSAPTEPTPSSHQPD